MKKVIALVLTFVMVFALCACGGGSDEKVIKIGVYEPQTGANGAGGKQEILGMEYANSVCPTVTIGGVEYKIELVYGDNESNTEKAVSAATKIISEGVSVVLGSYGSAVAIAASDTFKNAGVPAIGVTCTNPQVTEDNSDFTSYLNNAKKEGAKAIFAPVSIQYAQLIVEQANAQGIKIPLLGSDTWDNNTIVEATVGKNSELYVSTFYAEGGNAEFEKGIKEWMNADSKRIDNNGGNDMLAAVTVMGYDAYMVAVEAIKAADSSDPAAVMAALPNVKYSGISGDISFNETGDAKRDSAFIKQANSEKGVWDFVAVQKA